MTKNNLDSIEQDFPGHYCDAKRCNFFRTTDVNDWRVSTIGDYYRDAQRKTLSMVKDSYYESMVFALSDTTCPCGCGVQLVADWSGVEFNHYPTEDAALEGHGKLVQKYANMSHDNVPRSMYDD